MKKIKFRNITQFCVAEEVRKGNEVRILDKLTEKVYRAENMTALEYINMIEDDNYSRYECWVVEVEVVKKSNPLEKAIEEVKRVSQREDILELLNAISLINRIDDDSKEDEE